MLHFIRSFAVTVSVIFLVLITVLTFGLINENMSESGFSSGEILVADFKNGILSGEIMGNIFSADFSFLFSLPPVLKSSFLLLPPCSQFIIRILIFIFAVFF